MSYGFMNYIDAGGGEVRQRRRGAYEARKLVLWLWLGCGYGLTVGMTLTVADGQAPSTYSPAYLVPVVSWPP